MYGDQSFLQYNSDELVEIGVTYSRLPRMTCMVYYKKTSFWEPASNGFSFVGHWSLTKEGVHCGHYEQVFVSI